MTGIEQALKDAATAVSSISSEKDMADFVARKAENAEEIMPVSLIRNESPLLVEALKRKKSSTIPTSCLSPTQTGREDSPDCRDALSDIGSPLQELKTSDFEDAPLEKKEPSAQETDVLSASKVPELSELRRRFDVCIWKARSLTRSFLLQSNWC